MLSWFSGAYFLTQENSFFGAHLFFFFYALLQSMLEVSLLILGACLLRRWASACVFQMFIGLSFALLLAHYTDFTLLCLMDTSFSYILKFFFGSGVDHLLTAFLALNMNLTMVCIILSSIILVPLIGIGFYAFTERRIVNKSLRVSLKQLLIWPLCIGLSLLLLDGFAYPRLNRLAYDKYEKALPLGFAFFSPPKSCCSLKKALPELRAEEMISAHIEKLPPSQERLPNIYFFIIETLRSDFIKPEVAPNLFHFANQHIALPRTFANANYTNLSWFALLHSAFPHQWTQARDSYKEGAAPLRALKKLGYKIRIYSSSDLSYFQMQKTLFGEKSQLIDSLEQYSDLRNLEPCERDALAIQSFAKDLENQREGTFFLFFLDSTHSEYSFPTNFPLKFTPISDRISYLTISKSSPDLDRLKNRYRNSIAYVDFLVGKFLSLLKEKNLYDESIIAFTGDHGEEFFEEGSLFHGTHLNHYQTAVPIACKLGSDAWKEKIDQTRTQMSHVDLLPSILHYLTKSNDLAPLFDGQSIFSKMKWPYHLSVLQNGPNPPVEFCLEREGQKVALRFSDATTAQLLQSHSPDSQEIASQLLEGLEKLR